MLQGINAIDQSIYNWINQTFRSAFLDEVSPFAGSVFFYFPFLIFLLSLILQRSGPKLFIDIVFGLSTWAVSIQLAKIAALAFQRIAPWQFIALVHGGQGLESMEFIYSFPDWQITAYVASVVFSIRKLGKEPYWILPVSIIVFIYLAFLRMYAGSVYFTDILGGIILGYPIGFLLQMLSIRAGKSIKTSGF